LLEQRKKFFKRPECRKVLFSKIPKSKDSDQKWSASKPERVRVSSSKIQIIKITRRDQGQSDHRGCGLTKSDCKST